MDSFTREKNYVGKDQIIVHTSTGEFVISLEDNGKLYIGLYSYKNNPESISFDITKNSKQLYEYIQNLYYSLTTGLYKHDMNKEKPIKSDKVFWKSDDFDQNEASVLEISKHDEVINLKLYRSKSKDKCNSYFVCISNDSSRYGEYNKPFFKMYDKLTNPSILSDTGFLMLFCAVMFKNGHNIVINKNLLAEKLYELKDDEEFKPLLSNIKTKEYIDFKFLDLDNACFTAFTYDIISYGNDKNIMIKLTEEEADNIINSFRPQNYELMTKLCSRLCLDSDEIKFNRLRK